MVPDARAESEAEEPTVMAAVDADRLVIADVSRDGAWLAAPLADAATLADHR